MLSRHRARPWAEPVGRGSRRAPHGHHILRAGPGGGAGRVGGSPRQNPQASQPALGRKWGGAVGTGRRSGG